MMLLLQVFLTKLEKPFSFEIPTTSPGNWVQSWLGLASALSSN